MAESEPAFIPGLALSRAYYEEAVRPILAQRFPALDYAAALDMPPTPFAGWMVMFSAMAVPACRSIRRL